MLRVSWHVRHKAMCIGPGPWGCEDTCWPFPKCSPVLTGSPNSSMTRARLGLAAEPRELGASARCRCAYWPGFTQWTVASAISPGSLRSLSTLAMTFPGTKIPDGERAPLPSTRCGRRDLGGAPHNVLPEQRAQRGVCWDWFCQNCCNSDFLAVETSWISWIFTCNYQSWLREKGEAMMLVFLNYRLKEFRLNDWSQADP